jgi:hypothetical protein
VSIETATYLDDLNASLPAGTDDRSEGDNHIRLLKSVLQNTFPNITGAVTVTQSDLNSIGTFASSTGETWTGTHDFTGATITVPTQTAGDNTTKAASTAFVTAAVSGATAGSAPTLSVVTGTTQTAVANTHYVLTNASATTVTLPGSPSAGDEVWVSVSNGRVDNVIAGGGSDIMNIGEDLTIDNAYATVRLRYVNSTLGWWIT